MGIGEATVKDLYNCGAKVAIFDMADPKEENLNENIKFFKLDIRNKEEVENAVQGVLKEFGQIDALVNDAGVTRPRILVDYYGKEPKYELDEEMFDFMVSVNQKGTFIVTQAVTRVFFEQKSGVIINLSSCAGLMGSKGHSCYAGTKAAIHAYTISWAKELGPYNIRVVGVAPDILDRTPANNDEKYRAQAYGRGWSLDTKPEEFFKKAEDGVLDGGEPARAADHEVGLDDVEHVVLEGLADAPGANDDLDLLDVGVGLGRLDLGVYGVAEGLLEGRDDVHREGARGLECRGVDDVADVELRVVVGGHDDGTVEDLVLLVGAVQGDEDLVVAEVLIGLRGGVGHDGSYL